MQTPPPKPHRDRTWLLWFVIPAGVLLFIAVIVFAVVFVLFGLPYTQFAQHRLAPDGWSTPRISRLPDDSGFVGTWRPSGRSTALPFADGTPHTLAPEDDLTLNPDHTYRFLRHGEYNADSQLICLRTEAGQWQLVREDYPRLILRTDIRTIVVEHRVVPDLNTDNIAANQMKEEGKHPDAPIPVSQPGDDKRIVDFSNALACSSSTPNMGGATDWRVGTARGGRLALFREAPALTYDPSDPGTRHQSRDLAAQVIYEHQAR